MCLTMSKSGLIESGNNELLILCDGLQKRCGRHFFGANFKQKILGFPHLGHFLFLSIILVVVIFFSGNFTEIRFTTSLGNRPHA